MTTEKAQDGCIVRHDGHIVARVLDTTGPRDQWVVSFAGPMTTKDLVAIAQAVDAFDPK